jgi:hypothetical protein
MTRNHVHFATGLPEGFESLETSNVKGSAEPVISGMRKSSSILVFLDLEKALAGGLKFWKSANGVVLCDGGEQRLVPMEYFKRVEERGSQGKILIRDGVPVQSKWSHVVALGNIRRLLLLKKWPSEARVEVGVGVGNWHEMNQWCTKVTGYISPYLIIIYEIVNKELSYPMPFKNIQEFMQLFFSKILE